ncbi:hypothetical protein RB653_009452 [Dictyostelium firmibasis]|uniref:non-specific serine/threonine protein kinase n=1 Tax=Dictyostelium firmibasis TaxID=79012 RepID=A0AAN7YTT0_9MYCE
MKSILKKAKHFFHTNETANGEHGGEKTAKESESQHHYHDENGANPPDQGVDEASHVSQSQPTTSTLQQTSSLQPSSSLHQIPQSQSSLELTSTTTTTTTTPSTPTKQLPPTPQQQQQQQQHSQLNNNDISISTNTSTNTNNTNTNNNIDSTLTTPVPSSENLATLSTSTTSEQQPNTQSTPNNANANASSPPQQTTTNLSTSTTTTASTTNENHNANANNTQEQTVSPNKPPQPPNALPQSSSTSTSSTSLLSSTFSKFKIKLGSGSKNKDSSSAPGTPHNINNNNTVSSSNKNRSTLVITPGSVNNNNNNQNNHKNNNTTPDHPPEEQKPVEKEVITIATIADFPEDCQKLIRISGIPEEKLIKNIQILAYVLHFRTGRFFKLVDEPPREPRKKFISERFNDGEKLLEPVEPALLKKMYKDSDQVGKGGFGTVYFAKSTKEKRLVAIKKMPHITKRQQQQNFREAAILAKCDHPNIVKLHTCHIDKDSNLWIVMEFMEGGTFEEAAKAWKFNENNLAYVAKELLKGLQYLHENNMVHRDLKSANIMMSVEGKVKLIDFGLCEDIASSTPMHMVGSPFWMAPEMIQQKYHSTPVDIWSFAISLLEMANQRPPMMESAVKAMFTVATDGATGFDDPTLWSDCFKDFLSLCLKQDPAERATAEELLKHPFIKKADSRDNMENILKKIFLTNSLMNSGF